MSKVSEFLERFRTLPREKQLLLYAFAVGWVKGLETGQVAVQQPEKDDDAPTLDRDVWGEVEELL